MEEQPNIPGTVDEHPNWRRRMPGATDALLAAWRSLTPADRGRALERLLAGKAATSALLERMEAGKVRPAELDATARQRLLHHPDVALRDRRRLFRHAEERPIIG